MAEITLTELLAGKATRIKNREYFPTASYVEPFIERASKLTTEFRVQAKIANQISLTKDGSINTEDIIYNRVNIEAILPDEYAFEGHKRVLGFVYGLDTRKPIVKQYVGAIRSCCLNLTVFNPEALCVQELEPESSIDYRFFNTCMDISDNIKEKLNKLFELEYTRSQCYTELGQWIDRCINSKYNSGFGLVKIAESTPVEAYKNLFYNEKSDYYTEENIISGFDIYNAFTDIICNGKSNDLMNRFEKCCLVSKIMNI